MCSNDMPLAVWKALLKSLLVGHRAQLEREEIDYPLDSLLEIARFQIRLAPKKREKRAALCDWHVTLTAEDRELIQWFIKTVFDGTLPKWFLSGTVN